MSRKYTTIAIAYDFDGTLAPGNMQENSFIPKLGIDKKTFWNEAGELAKKNDMNGILAYMYLMIKKADSENIPITKNAFIEHGREIRLFRGVEDYFGKINQYAKEKHLKIDHYIISSGLDDILKGTKIYKEFRQVYASSFLYDANEVAKWPALAIDYTNKTQFLFRINKGIENAWENHEINAYMPNDERPMPFKRMIYIGDGETDIPAMKVVKTQNGKAIAVYNPESRTQAGRRSKEVVKKLIEENRADFIAPADYTEGGSLFKIIQLCIDSMAAEIELQKFKK